MEDLFWGFEDLFGALMAKGAKPGQRRGGRRPGTLNRATILAERILALAATEPSLSVRQFLAALTRDPGLPADVVMKLLKQTQRPMRGKKSELETLLRIARDLRSSPKDRKSAAAKMAKIFLPEKPANPEWRYKKGQYGFLYSKPVAKEYRDLSGQLFEWRAADGSKLSLTDFKKGNERLQELRLRLVRRPAPIETYGKAQVLEDEERLAFLYAKRGGGSRLTESEDEEEIERRARFDGFVYGLQQIAFGRRHDLEGIERRLQRAALEQGGQDRLSSRDEAELLYLRNFFPKPQQPVLNAAIRDANLADGHPFATETPGPDGCFRVSWLNMQAPETTSSNRPV